MLREERVYQDLKSLTSMAIDRSIKAPKGCRYEAMKGAFCDGFEVRLGEIPQQEAESMKSTILNHIHGTAKDLSLKNIKITHRNELTYAWFTLKPETAWVNESLLVELKNIVRVVKDNLALFWDHNEDEVALIKLTKLDITQDLSGSFMPKWKGDAF